MSPISTKSYHKISLTALLQCVKLCKWTPYTYRRPFVSNIRCKLIEISKNGAGICALLLLVACSACYPSWEDTPVGICYSEPVSEASLTAVRAAVHWINTRTCDILAQPASGHCEIGLREWDRCNNAIAHYWPSVYIELPPEYCHHDSNMRMLFAVHELLHELGLGHDDDDPYSIMHPTVMHSGQVLTEEDKVYLVKRYCYDN